MFFLVSFICILILAGIITLIINAVTNNGGQNVAQSSPQSGTTQNSQSQQVSAAQQTAQSTAQNSGVNSQQTAAQGTAQSSTQQSTNAQQTGNLLPHREQQNSYTLPNASTMALPLNGTAPQQYYDNVLIMGDSLVQSMQLFKEQGSNATFAPYYNSSPKDIISGEVTNASGQRVNAIDEMVSIAKQNVYIALGTDSLDELDNDEFVQSYDELLTELKEKMPENTVYYLVSVLPVSSQKANEDENYSIDRINTLNNEIAVLAYKHNMNYLYINSDLSDENGYLKQEFLSGTGGIKINSDACSAIFGHIITHTSYISTGRL